MSSLGSLVVSLAMDTARFVGDVGKAAQQMGRLTAEAGKMATAIGAAVGTGAKLFAGFVNESVRAADKTSKLAASAGMTTEEFSRLAYAADLGGVSTESFASKIGTFNRNIVAAARGSGSAAAGFDAMGISLRRTDGTLKSNNELLEETAAKFAMYEAGAERSALAQSLFGKSGDALVPMLASGRDGLAAMGKEADAFGLTLNAKTGAAAERFRDNLTRLNRAKEGLGLRIAQELLPTLESMTTELLSTAQGSETLARAADIAVSAVRLLAGAGVGLVGVFNTAGQALGGVAAAAVALFSGRFAEAARIAADTGTDLVANVRSSYGLVRSIISGEANSIATDAPRVGGLIAAPLVQGAEQAERAAGRVREAARQARDAIETQMQSLVREIATFSASETERTVFDLTIAGAEPEQIERARQLLGVLESLRAERDETARVAAEQAATERELAAIYDATRTPIEKLNIELARLAQLREAVGADQEALARAEFAAWERYAETVKESTKELDTFGQTFLQNAQSYAGEQFVALFSGSFRQIGRGFTQMIQRMVAEAAAAQLMRNLFGTAGIGGGGGFAGTLMNVFKGFATSAASGIGYVPYDGMPAILHRGERVMTAPENQKRMADEEERASGRQGEISLKSEVNVYGNPDISVATIRSEIERANARLLRQLSVRGGV